MTKSSSEPVFSDTDTKVYNADRVWIALIGSSEKKSKL